MKTRVRSVLSATAEKLVAEGALPAGLEIFIDTPKEESFGDFFTNLAMDAASRLRLPPQKVARRFVDALGDGDGLFAKVEVAGPGFINLTLSPGEWYRSLLEVGQAGEAYGQSAVGAGRKVQVEFVSANPTGPLHVGHGRGAAVGDVLANLLRAAGYDVDKEYYINDAGRQMELLGKSVLARYRQLLGAESEFPEDGYKGEYIMDVARDLILKKGRKYLDHPPEEAVPAATDFAMEVILKGIRQDLEDFGVGFDHWVSERALLAKHPLEKLLAELQAAGHAYRADDALWLRTTAFGDSKDRVLVRANGQPTYFANDIIYHREKYRRGYDLVIDIWGADHHGYVDRMQAAVQTIGGRADSLRVILVQLVRLLRKGEVVAMSTRAGEFDTLRQVMDEVGRDAARFFFLTRRADAQLDFDLELAKSQSSENPVYYVQYAHARIQSIFKKLGESEESRFAKSDPARLVLPEELSLIKKVVLYPDLIAAAAQQLEPHRVAFFLTDLASAFHQYYNRHRVISDDDGLTAARLFLIRLIGRVLAHGLAILGVSAPASM